MRVLLQPFAVAVTIALAGWVSCSADEAAIPYSELTSGAGGGLGENPITVSVGSTGGVGGAGGSTTASSASVTTGTPCPDTGPGEPNETEAEAYQLAIVTDCDDTGGSVMGILPPGDVDWYSYIASDVAGCTVDPTRELFAAEPMRLCKFAECQGGGAADVTCNGGSMPATSPDGRPGCCAGHGFDVDVDCPGIDDDATMFIRIDQAPDCADYSLTFHY